MGAHFGKTHPEVRARTQLTFAHSWRGREHINSLGAASALLGLEWGVSHPITGSRSLLLWDAMVVIGALWSISCRLNSPKENHAGTDSESKECRVSATCLCCIPEYATTYHSCCNFKARSFTLPYSPGSDALVLIPNSQNQPSIPSLFFRVSLVPRSSKRAHERA